MADPPVALRGMVEECDALVSALTTFKACPHLEAGDRDDLDDWLERAGKDIAAGRKAQPEPSAQKAIAQACARAARSALAATTRCEAGPTPRDAWYLRRR